MNGWISVKDRLPDENEDVLILVGNKMFVARISKGISKQQRREMKEGKLNDPRKEYWGGNGFRSIRRSEVFTPEDEDGNNKVPYLWEANAGPMQWFGQEVSHWMPLPEYAPDFDFYHDKYLGEDIPEAQFKRFIQMAWEELKHIRETCTVKLYRNLDPDCAEGMALCAIADAMYEVVKQDEAMELAGTSDGKISDLQKSLREDHYRHEAGYYLLIEQKEGEK